MTIRFLQTCASENPAFPFQAGQLITVAVPSVYLRSLLDGVRAEIVAEDVLELAIESDPTRPEPDRPKGRRYARH